MVLQLAGGVHQGECGAKWIVAAPRFRFTPLIKPRNPAGQTGWSARDRKERAGPMAVRYESRERPCTSCGAMVSVQVVTSEAPRSVGPQRRAIHDDDGTPAD